MRSGNTVWLVGMMGAGKSAVGAVLADRLGRAFVDTDLEIAAEVGRSIAEIFAVQGEGSFRSLERAKIRQLAGKDLVVALGGGAIAQRGIPRQLADSGLVVYLRAKPQTLLARLDDGTDRPLLAGLESAARAKRIEELLAERREAYETAHIAIDTDGDSIADVVAALLQEVRQRTSRGDVERGG